VNLRIPAYIASKFTVLGSLCVFQCAALLCIVGWGCGLRGSFLGMLLVLFLVSLVGVGIGLTISALARTSEVAIALLPLVLLPMVDPRRGSWPRLDSMPTFVRACANCMASRWAFEGLVLLESNKRDRFAMPVLMQASPNEPSLEKGRSLEVARAVSLKDVAEDYFPVEKQRTGVVVLL